MSELIRIRGVVQGVGFRPTVARVARAQGLPGFVRNDAAGVLIGLAAEPDACERFLETLLASLPPLAKVESVERSESEVVAHSFVIDRSEHGSPATEVAADAASCAACVREVFDPSERRFRYPFTTCTHCGPRYSIVEAIPYDRQNTTMASFALCDDCRREYEDETDRRHHAQPLACARCGPHARLERAAEREPRDQPAAEDDVEAAAALLRDGEIVAIKGLGGYQLCCDATSSRAVARLRERKRRTHEPFALMVPSAEAASRLVRLEPEDVALLESPEAPIVLADRRADAQPDVAAGVAPGLSKLGVMLPTSPLHALLLARVERPVVCTSGNVSHEPQCIDDDDARTRLAPIADWLLVHDRPIRNRVDDSVVTRMDGAPRVLRRARGFAPGALPLPPGFEEAAPVLAMGGDLKGAFGLLDRGRLVLSPHLGDLDHPSALEACVDTLELVSSLYRHEAESVVVDAHPGYRSNELGRRLAAESGLPVVEVFHHHAHLASCLAENGRPRDAGPVLALTLDGLGMGPGRQLWGGELLLGDYRSFTRLGSLKPVALLGGDAAAREPWRSLYAQLRAAMSWDELDSRFGDLEAVRHLRGKPIALLESMLDSGARAPLASSTGRLFDAVAAAVGVARERTEREAQAAIALEALVTTDALAAAARAPYPFALEREAGSDLLVIDPRETWHALLGDLLAGVDAATISARFHAGLAGALVRSVASARERCGVETDAVALSGGCFQNRVLFERVAAGLRETGLEVLTHRKVPSNDGGLALGQAVIAAARED